MFKQTAKSLLKKAGVFPQARIAYRRLNPLIALLRMRDIQLYRSLLKPNSLVFDVGANLGQKSDIFLAAGFRTIVIEPNLRCQHSLELQFKNNPRATIVRKAVGAAMGASVLYADGSDAAGSLLPGWNQKLYAGTRRIEEQPVEMTTLDNLIDEFGSPDYIKIDVEGFEQEVLRGLSQPVPLLSFEFHARDLQSANSCLQILSRFKPLMFRPADMHGRWISRTMKDASQTLRFIDSTKSNGDLYVWMPTT